MQLAFQKAGYTDQSGQGQYMQTNGGNTQESKNNTLGQNAILSPEQKAQLEQEITTDMSEQERYKILKEKTIQPQILADIENAFDVAFLENNIKSIVEKPLIRKLQELGYTKEYTSPVVDVAFELTARGIRKSIHSQASDYGGSFGDFAKVVVNLQKLLDHAVLLDVHTDKGKGTSRENSRLRQTYVLASALQENGVIIPVQFEVKRYVDEANRLYLTVALTKTETGVMGNTVPQSGARTYLLPVSSISISDFFASVNPKDYKFFKYVPDGFLNAEQLAAKQRALEEDQKKYSVPKTGYGQNAILSPEQKAQLERVFLKALESGEVRGSGVNDEVSKQAQNALLNPERLTKDVAIELMENCQNGVFNQKSYIPVSRTTPSVVIDHVQRYIELKKLPMVMEVGKVQQMIEEADVDDGGSRLHGVDSTVASEIFEGLFDPQYVVFQADNGRVGVLVKMPRGHRGMALVVIAKGRDFNPDLLNGYASGAYNVSVTLYSLNDVQYYLSQEENIIVYEKSKVNHEEATGSHVPSLSNDSPYLNTTLSQNSVGVNTQSMQSGAEYTEKGIPQSAAQPQTAPFRQGGQGGTGQNAILSPAWKAQLERVFLKALESGEVRGTGVNGQGQYSVETTENVTSPIEKYSEEQYNAFGWASYNGIITAKERQILFSHYADFKHNKNQYPVTRWGEAVMHSTECPDVIMYVKGSIRVPHITRIVRITATDIVDVEAIQREVLFNEQEQISQPYETVEFIYGEEIFCTYKKRDCISFQEYTSREKRGNSGNAVSFVRALQDGGRSDRGGIKGDQADGQLNTGANEGSSSVSHDIETGFSNAQNAILSPEQKAQLERVFLKALESGENAFLTDNAKNSLHRDGDSAIISAEAATDSLTYAEEDTLLAYKSGGSYTINAKLLSGDSLSPYEQAVVEGLDGALTKLPIYRGTVYRNIIFDGFGDRAAVDAFLEEYVVGRKVMHPSYTSTSTDLNGYPVEGRYIVHYKIQSATGRDMQGYGNNAESEVLIPRNAVFLVDDIRYDRAGTPTIYLTEMENDEQSVNTGRSGKGVGKPRTYAGGGRADISGNVSERPDLRLWETSAGNMQQMQTFDTSLDELRSVPGQNTESYIGQRRVRGVRADNGQVNMETEESSSSVSHDIEAGFSDAQNAILSPEQKAQLERVFLKALESGGVRGSGVNGEGQYSIGPAENANSPLENHVGEEYNEENARGENLIYGESRQETREAFLRRADEEKLTVKHRGKIAYGYRRTLPTNVKERSRQVGEELKRLGVPSVIYDRLEANRNGVTSVHVPEAATLRGDFVFISNALILNPKEVAGHEAYHYWASSDAWNTYKGVLGDNIDYSSKRFITFIEEIQSATGRDMQGYGNNAESEVLIPRNVMFFVDDIQYGREGTPTFYLTEMENYEQSINTGGSSEDIGKPRVYAGGGRADISRNVSGRPDLRLRETTASDMQRLQTFDTSLGSMQPVSTSDTGRSVGHGGMRGVRADNGQVNMETEEGSSSVSHDIEAGFSNAQNAILSPEQKAQLERVFLKALESGEVRGGGVNGKGQYSIDSWRKKSYNKIKLSAEEYRRLTSEALTWHTTTTEIVQQTLSNGYTYAYYFDSERSVVVLNKYRAKNIHEQNEVREYEKSRRNAKRNDKAVDRYDGELRRRGRSDHPALLSIDGGTDGISYASNGGTLPKARPSDQPGYAESTSDSNRTERIKAQLNTGANESSSSVSHDIEAGFSDAQNAILSPEQKAQLEQIAARFGVDIELVSPEVLTLNKNTATNGSGGQNVIVGQYDYSRSFAEQIKDYQSGAIPKNDTLIVGATPDVFQQIGMAPLPVTINTTHVDYALNGTKDFDHHLGEALLAQLPEAIKSPVAIMTSGTKSNNSIVAMLEIRHNGKQVVVPVVVDGFGTQNGIRIDSNAIASAYGKDYSLSKVLSNAINQHNSGAFRLYYLDAKKATALLQGAKVPMPKMPATHNGGFISSLTDPRSPVKSKIASVTESQQFKRWFGDWQNTPKTASKVVNADGTPKVVYHGTDQDFNVFHSKKAVYWFPRRKG